MMYLLLASFFYSNVIYRLPIGHYGYVLASDIVSWLIILIFLARKVAGGTKPLSSGRGLGICLALLNLLMYLLLIRVYFGANRVFSEFGRATVDTLRCTQFIFGYYAIRGSSAPQKKNWQYLQFIFALAVIVAVCGLLTDVALVLPRHYAGIEREFNRPVRQFTAFFTDNHGSAAVYLLTAISIGFGLLLRRYAGMYKAFIACCVGILSIALMFSESRAGYIGLASAAAIFAVRYIRMQKNRIGAVFTLAVPTIIAVLLVFAVVDTSSIKQHLMISSVEQVTHYDREQSHISSKEQKINILSIRSRLENWQNTLNLIDKMSYNIAFGYGVNQQTFLANYGGAHNNILQVLIDLGVVGLLIFLKMLHEIKKSFRSDRDCYDDSTRALNVGMMCGFIGLCVTALTQETFYMMPALGNFFGFYLIVVAIVENINGGCAHAAGSSENLLPQS